MARRVTTGVLGGPILGNLKATTNLITAARVDENITLQGNGTGVVVIDDVLELRSQNSIKLSDLNNTGSVNLKSPSTVSGTVDLTLPDNTPAQNYVLAASDANGNLEWSAVVVQSDVDSATNAELPVYFGDTATAAASGAASINTLYRETSDFSYNPGSNRLTVTNLTATDLTATDLTVSNALNAGSITETSSLVLKENINPITDALDKILGLDGVTFNRKSTGKLEAGFIAEDVEKIIPELVDNDGDYKTITYTRITAYLIEAIKKLKQEIDDLKKK